uniref:Uncharacterized protein n=1 Tax=Babesia bovis TaxID=5865 RepID=S6B857_BABBO|nr:hypothetical protein [Babesia bovis]
MHFPNVMCYVYLCKMKLLWFYHCEPVIRSLSVQVLYRTVLANGSLHQTLTTRM